MKRQLISVRDPGELKRLSHKLGDVSTQARKIITRGPRPLLKLDSATIHESSPRNSWTMRFNSS